MRRFVTFAIWPRSGAAEVDVESEMSAICFSYAEVTSINKLGFWLQFGAEELYLSFVEFPRFEHATIAQITRVVCPSSSRVYWPELDLDLALDTIRNPLACDFHRASHDR
jgi:hypothetical protein